MNNQANTNSEYNRNTLEQLELLVSRYPVDIDKFQELLLTIETNQTSDNNALLAKIQSVFNKLLMTLLNIAVNTSSPDWQKKCGLPEDRLRALKGVLQVVCGGPASQKLKRSIVISFIENVLECLGVCDLTEVLDVISSQIPRFASQLQEIDQLKLLRVINVLLKTVSKTEDYYLRGQLHLALTRFLPLCHDSGFHFRAPNAKAEEWEKLGPGEEANQSIQPGITYEFYVQFWELQKWLLEPNQVGSEGMLARLKKIEQMLKQVEQYFETHAAKEGQDYYTQPVKFLKNYNLLALQLSDLGFRKTIMLQALLFTHAIVHPLSRAPIIMTELEKKIIADIEGIAKKFLMNCGEQGKKLLEVLPKLMEGQLEWANLKEHWKDKKKNFTKRAEQYAQDQAKTKEQIRKAEKQIEKRKAETKKLIAEKMKIQGGKIQKFLQNSEPINLQSGPTYTSFSYFFSQAMSCLESFDRQNGKQAQFQTRAEYNMFEWKAMRSLYRQNIKDIWSSNDKAPPKMKQYRLISLMSRKQEQFSDPEPSKKIKTE